MIIRVVIVVVVVVVTIIIVIIIIVETGGEAGPRREQARTIRSYQVTCCQL